VSIDDGRETVVPGELLTYTISFQGQDPMPDGGKLVARIPEHTTFHAAAGNWDIRGSGSVEWNLEPLDSNFDDAVRLVVQVDPVLPDGTLIENATTFMGNNENVQDGDETVVTSSPDLSNSQVQVSKESAYAGDTLAYTIILSNTGTMNADTVTMTNAIPSYTNYLAGSVSGGSYDPTEQVITWTGPLTVGNQVTIMFSAVITELVFIPGGETINSVAQIDDGYSGHEILDLQTETKLFGEARPDRYKAYLPLILQNYAPEEPVPPSLPDLVVTEILVTPENPAAGETVDIAVTIKNQGTRTPVSCFWVDLYINPTKLPIEVNMGWFEAGSEGGLVWALCGTGLSELEAGESMTLRIDDDYYREDMSNFAGSFGSPTTQTLYVQVDSWNPGADHGAVYESNEGNNVYGPHNVSITSVTERSEGTTEARPAPIAPPPRPNLLTR
jgi:uncharacterized repeat protein (TIGR01451 family)